MPITPPRCPPIPERKLPPRPPPTPPPRPNLDPKILKILEKYPFNWRLTQLSGPRKPIAKKFVPTKEPIGYYDPIVKSAVLNGKIPERTKDVKTTPLWRLRIQKKYFNTCKTIPKKKRKTRFHAVNGNIKKTWNSVYYYYRKTIAAKKKKEAAARSSIDSKTKKKGKSKTERIKDAIEYCKKMAVPKRVFVPTPKPRKIVKDWNALLVHLDILSEPPHRGRKYKRPSIDSQYVDPSKVSPKALKYQISPRVDDLAHKLPERYTRKEKPIIPGAVRRGALKAKISPRIEEISAPRKRADAPEMDVKENPFSVSKNALKYKPTPRIEELAKPVERK